MILVIPEVRDALREEAARQRRSLSALISILLEDWVAHHRATRMDGFGAVPRTRSQTPIPPVGARLPPDVLAYLTQSVKAKGWSLSRFAARILQDWAEGRATPG